MKYNGENMRHTSCLSFTENEKELNCSLDSLFSEWVARASNCILPDNYQATDLVFEGFYPYYLSQPKKILFIGRESLGISGDNYIDTLYYHYKNHHIGNVHINSHVTHRRLLKIGYGLIKNISSYSEIPDADIIADDFATPDGTSFAFMNLSKFSNESESFLSDWNLINQFIMIFKEHEYSSKQIEIMDPDLIISMNLENKLDSLGKNDLIDCSETVAYRKLTIGEKMYNTLDTFHFSAYNKIDELDFYKPILEMCKKHNL